MNSCRTWRRPPITRGAGTRETYYRRGDSGAHTGGRPAFRRLRLEALEREPPPVSESDPNFVVGASGLAQRAAYSPASIRFRSPSTRIRPRGKSAKLTSTKTTWSCACYDGILRIGIHTTSQGSLEKTALKAYELGANTFQIFSASPRMWRASPPSALDCQLLSRARQKLDLTPLVIHDNYLINLASIDPDIRSKSILAFRGELERAAMIGAEYLVAHPGSYRNHTPNDGIVNFAHGVAEAASGVPFGKVMLLVECTAGGGCLLGSRFEELRAIRDLASTLTDLPIGYCLDTCHLLSAGFDIRTEAGLNQTMREADRILGASNIKVIHANDSKTSLGSRVDRHENIGQGCIGEEAFRRILNHPKLRKLPFILETPVDDEGDDRRNLETLKKLCPKRSTTTTKSS